MMMKIITTKNIMRAIAAIAALGTLALITLGLLHPAPTTTSSDINPQIGLEEGQAAPNFTVSTLSGQKVSLSDFRGKPVMLNFWFIECPACRAETPDLQNFYAATQKDLVILGINVVDSRADVSRFADRHQLTYPLGLDYDHHVARLYGIEYEPTSYFLDSRGIIRARIEGPVDEAQLEKLMVKIRA